jgi:hypothetical protein
MMPWSEKGDRVVIDMTREEYNLLLIALGYATGAAKNLDLQQAFLRLVNMINEGNPNYTPYEVEGIVSPR